MRRSHEHQDDSAAAHGRSLRKRTSRDKAQTRAVRSDRSLRTAASRARSRSTAARRKSCSIDPDALDDAMRALTALVGVQTPSASALRTLGETFDRRPLFATALCRLPAQQTQGLFDGAIASG